MGMDLKETPCTVELISLYRNLEMLCIISNALHRMHLEYILVKSHTTLELGIFLS